MIVLGEGWSRSRAFREDVLCRILKCMKTASLFVLPLALGLCLTAVVYGRPRPFGAHGAKVEVRSVQAATSASFSGALDVEVRRAPAPRLTIEAQPEVLRHVRSESRGGRLRVWTEGSIQTDGNIRVRYWTPSLANVEVSGATNLDVDTLSGANVRVVATGASKVKANGRTERLAVEVAGASEARLRGVDAVSVQVEATGASKAWVTARKQLGAVASGASEILYWGKPEVLRKNSSGASSVNPG